MDRGAWGLLSIGSHRVGHDRSDLACIHALEEEMATHPSILAWRIPGTEKPGGCCLWGSTELDTTEATQQQHHLEAQYDYMRYEIIWLYET